jgi:hypothetical protein
MKILHVHQQRIRANIKAEPADRLPPIILIEGKARRYAHSVEIHGPCRLVYSPDKPLSCGARLWISTDAEVEIIE